MTATPRRHFLAIRHKPSGGYLPSQNSYGFTRAVPSCTEPPRLFTKPGAAKQALNRWLEGEWYEGVYDEDSGETTIKVFKRPERRREDMEIVEAEITIRSLSDAQLMRL